MSDNKKTFLIIRIGGNRKVKAESEQDAWHKAIVKGWKPLFVEEAKDDEKETHL